MNIQGKKNEYIQTKYQKKIKQQKKRIIQSELKIFKRQLFFLSTMNPVFEEAYTLLSLY